ncbi:hypothetical protein RZS08_43295, partial [Arthrospira platensis SPKY1]|nr:hypothetical protein [Arthrospira platensis SPKY1]
LGALRQQLQGLIDPVGGPDDELVAVEPLEPLAGHGLVIDHEDRERQPGRAGRRGIVGHG